MAFTVKAVAGHQDTGCRHMVDAISVAAGLAAWQGRLAPVLKGSPDRMPDRPLPAPGRTAVRPEWTSVPVAVRDGIDGRLGGSVEDAESQSGGFTPGLAVRLRISGRKDRVFVKAAPADHPVADSYRAEGAISARLPAGIPRPRLRWHGEVAGWVVLCYDDV